MSNDTTAIVKLVVSISVTLLVVVIFLSIWPLVQVHQTERVIIFRLGAINRVIDPGLHWKTPFVENYVRVNVSSLKDEASASAASKDLQTATTNVTINYSVDPAKVKELYTHYENDHSGRLVSPAIQEAVKATTAKYTAEELVTKREQIKSEISNSLKSTLSPEGLSVNQVFITDFRFSAEFDRAIEAKVSAEQNALTEQNNLKAAQYKAQAIQVTADAANNERYIELQRLEVEKAAIEKWNGQLPNQMIPGQALPFIQLNTGK